MRADLAIALAYNALAVALAFAGCMSPLALRGADARELSHHHRRDRPRSHRGVACGSLILQVFVSLMLVAGSVLLFAFTCRQRDFDHADRLALLPLDDEDEER